MCMCTYIYIARANVAPLIKLSIAFLSRNAIIFIRQPLATFARGQLGGYYTRLPCVRIVEKKIYKMKERERERYEGKEGKKYRAAERSVAKAGQLIA